MGKEGGCVGLGQEGLREGGGTVWNTLKGGGKKKRGGKTKILKRGGKLGQGVSALKKGGGGGLEPPYELCIFVQIYNFLGMLKLRET